MNSCLIAYLQKKLPSDYFYRCTTWKRVHEEGNVIILQRSSNKKYSFWKSHMDTPNEWIMKFNPVRKKIHTREKEREKIGNVKKKRQNKKIVFDFTIFFYWKKSVVIKRRMKNVCVRNIVCPMKTSLQNTRPISGYHCAFANNNNIQLFANCHSYLVKRRQTRFHKLCTRISYVAILSILIRSPLALFLRLSFRSSLCCRSFVCW